MAPDIDSIRWNGYDAPSEYKVQDITFDDPKTRPVKVLSIGCGVSGMMMAYKIQKECQKVELVMYEKNSDIGGTWLENRYPNAACDIPSHAYTFNFALYPDWPAYFAKSENIWNYLDRVCEVFGLRKYMNFNSQIVKAQWLDDDGKWRVTIDQKQPDGQVKQIEETCDVLLHATGILNRMKWPTIAGLDTFKGRIVHTSRWPDEYQEEQWKNERVAVIGSGASSIQTVPGMQPYVKHMDIYVRTGVWFVSIADNYGQNHIYTEDHKKHFRKSPKSMVKHAKYIEDSVNSLFASMFSGTEEQEHGRKVFTQRMAEHIKDKRLLEGFTPSFGLGCRRVTPGDPYMRAIQEPNVDVHFVAVDHLTEKGVVDSEGIEREVDTVVCATGFDTTFRPHFPIVGKNGTDLVDKWKLVPESYLGLTIPEMPNFFTFIGPTWPVENGSVMGPLNAVGDYAIAGIKKMQREHLKSFTPKQDVTDAFNNHTQEWIKKTVWAENCRSWYRNNETGRVNAVYPGSSLHYVQTLEHPRWEDYEFEYLNKCGGNNLWEFLGRGFSKNERTPGMDKSPYINEDVVDPEWKRQVWKQKYVPESKDDEIRRLKERVRQLEAEAIDISGP